MLQVEFHKTKKHFSGQALVEILIGVAVVGIVFVSAAELIFVSLKAARMSREKSLAQSLINDMGSAIKSIINYDWHNLWSTTGGLGYWHFDDGAGSANSNSTVIDEISGNNGTISLGSSGNTSLASAWLSSSNCKSGQCLSFDGIDDGLSMGNNWGSKLRGDLTISFWAYPTSFDPIANTILRRGQTHAEFKLMIFSGGYLSYSHDDSGSSNETRCTTASSVFSENAWTHVVVTRDVSEQSVSIYINGVIQTINCNSWVDIDTSSENLVLGYVPVYSGPYAGRIDDLRLFDSNLSGSEISGLYSGVASFYPENNSGIWTVHHGQASSTVADTNFTRYFMIGAVQRDSSNNIVSNGGDVDPTTKKISLITTWTGGQATQEEYISRTNLGNVFYQTDWSGGASTLETVFTTPKGFNTASTTIIYIPEGVNESTLSLSRPDPAFGTLTSMTFDSQIDQGISPFSLVWQGRFEGESPVAKFKIAASNSPSGPWTFVGSDGTSASFFPNSGTSQPNTPIKILLPQFYNQRYFRYLVYFDHPVPEGDLYSYIDDISIYWNR